MSSFFENIFYSKIYFPVLSSFVFTKLKSKRLRCKNCLHPKLVQYEFKIDHEVVNPLFGSLARTMPDVIINIQ